MSKTRMLSVPTKTKTLAAVLADARKKDADLSVGARDIFDVKIDAITTGNVALDAITGVGGIPRGRVIELYGPPMSGKTTTALQAAARHQQSVKAGTATGAILYLDHEKSLDEKYCAALGLDVNDEETFILVQPRSFEQGANLFRKILREAPGSLAMAIWDSVAVMTTEHELEVDTGAVQVGDRAKMMAQFLRQSIDVINRQNVAAIFLNHLQEVIDTSPMGRQMKARGIVRKKTPGGDALKYHASVRIEYKQIGNKRSPVYDPVSNEVIDEVNQTDVKVTVVKNKVAKPFKTVDVRVRFGKGFSQAYSVLEILLAYKIFIKSGAYYSFTGGFGPPDYAVDVKGTTVGTVHGEEKLLTMMENNSSWMKLLEDKAVALLTENGAFNADPKDWEHEDTEGIGIDPALLEDDDDLLPD